MITIYRGCNHPAALNAVVLGAVVAVQIIATTLIIYVLLRIMI